jgi:hypothetical protein
MNPASFRVHAPSMIVFLCGGAIDLSVSPPKMLRDAFYRITQAAPPNYKVILAEDAHPLTTEAGYKDLFSFESDIAQLVGLIVLFAESAGSLAELGAFSALETVAPSLLAVLDDFYYNQISFIRNGPVRFLENEYGDDWILVLDREELQIDGGDISKLAIPKFSNSILPVIDSRLSAKPKWSKYNPGNSGHSILIMVGLCQEYGALTGKEIKRFFDLLEIDHTRINNYLYCAELLGWIKKVRKGHHIFYVATRGDSALDYQVIDASPFGDKVRWRSTIRAFWQKKEPSRLRAIAEVIMPTDGAK